jgi:hypothetical protein
MLQNKLICNFKMISNMPVKAMREGKEAYCRKEKERYYF